MSDCNRKHYLRYSTHLTQNLTRYLGYSTHLTQSLKNLMPVLMMRSPILLKFLHLREMRLHFLGNTCTSCTCASESCTCPCAPWTFPCTRCTCANVKRSIDKTHHIEILRIIKNYSVVKLKIVIVSVYINLSFLPMEMLTEIEQYVLYIEAQERLAIETYKNMRYIWAKI